MVKILACPINTIIEFSSNITFIFKQTSKYDIYLENFFKLLWLNAFERPCGRLCVYLFRPELAKTCENDRTFS